VLYGVLLKAEFWHRHALTPFNERQRTMLNHVLDDFEGKPTVRACLPRQPPSTIVRIRSCSDRE
jgi:hypothetical protein